MGKAARAHAALLIVAMILILGGALSAPPKIKIIAGLSNAPMLRTVVAIASA
jgi:hypothetical protein